ncbi:MAG: DNA replication/repair protein RecF [bacterium]|nr:DNA replication/repair protein RecF [bacterium]
MQISRTKISNFRNFTESDIQFSPGVNIFYGSNGSGKTNLLEAIFVTCLGRSQRGAPDNLLLRHGEDVYRLEAELNVEEKEIAVSVAFQKNGRKKVTLDQVTARLGELYELFSIVSSGPEDSQIVSGSPSSRRTFLDIYLSQLSARYLDDLIQYQKALAQKNAALKREMDGSLFDELLIRYGTGIIAVRDKFIRDISDLAGDYYQEITGEHSLSVKYLPSIISTSENLDPDKIAEQFAVKMESSRRREQAIMSAMIGPHRDDIIFSIDGYPARHHGSQGEVRTAAIVLKLAVFQILKKRRNAEPILLLDEVFAELDEDRANGLIEAFGDFGQLFLTTALTPPERLASSGKSYQIEEGRVQEGMM